MTEQRPIQPTPVGALRFNTDTAKLEYFDGNEYVNIKTDSPEANTGGTRGLFQIGFDGSGYDDDVEFTQEECENTLTLLNKYIDDSEFDLDKSIVKGIMKEVYREACEFE